MSPEEKNKLVEDVLSGFEATQVHGGIIGPKEEVTVEFKYTGDPSLIDKILPDCGCTAMEDTVPEDGVIKAVYKENVTENLSEDKMKELYPAGVINISKGISLYLADGEEMYKENERGVVTRNPVKVKVRLTFNVDIKL